MNKTPDTSAGASVCQPYANVMGDETDLLWTVTGRRSLRRESSLPKVLQIMTGNGCVSAVALYLAAS